MEKVIFQQFMAVSKIDYYPSYIFGEARNPEKKILPNLKILSVTGYDPEKYKFWKNEYNRSHAVGEILIRYCITKTKYAVNPILGGWRTTRLSKDNKMFSDEIDLIPYNNLYDYNGICFILESTLIENGCSKQMMIAGAVLPLYNSKRVFRRGLYEIELHPLSPTLKSLDDLHDLILSPKFNGKPKSVPELNKLLKINRKRNRSELPSIPMDRKSMPEVEGTIERLKKDSGKVFLSVNFYFSRQHTKTNIPVIFCRRPILKELPQQVAHRHDKRNPVDEKYVKISRNPRSADTDKCRKPNTETIVKLKNILCRPPNIDLSDVENDLIWKYRFYLSEFHPEQALPKYLLTVKWEYSEQEKQAVELMLQWPTIAPINVLELLTSKFKGVVLVRRFAVCKLKEEKDEDLLLYLYQLVQALRYENSAEIMSTNPAEHTSEVDDEPEDVRASVGPLEASTPVPYDHSRFSDSSLQPGSEDYDGNQQTDLDRLRAMTVSPSLLQSPEDLAEAACKAQFDQTEALKNQDDLATFLIQRALRNWEVANYLYWFLVLESDKDTPSVEEIRAMYSHVLHRLYDALKNGDMQNRSWRSDLKAQCNFVGDLSALSKSIAEESVNRKRKIEILKKKLAGPAFEGVTHISHAFSFPLDPKFKVARVEPESAYLFKSAQKPALLTLVSPDGDKYRCIFKNGDDLRQDQLVLQMINFMDLILQKENFDLKLTPYKVLSTSCKNGFVQFIQSRSIADILDKEGSILTYLQQLAPQDKKDSLGVSKEVMENYLRSCAGYCVITYILGVGDRHMHNLMLTDEGLFFHIDFGFIIGNNPKPMPTEIRISKQMIEAMGGFDTFQFKSFCNYTYNAFLALRRYANLFLTLMSLVLDAGIQDIAREPSKACEFVKDRFLLDLNDETAVQRLRSKMIESVKAIMPEIMERLHAIAIIMSN